MLGRDRASLERMTNPYVFIVGCPRSGTTLLKRMVDAHPEIAIPRETHWIPQPFDRRPGAGADAWRAAVTAEATITPALLPMLAGDHRFTRMGVSPDELERSFEVDTRVPYASFVSRIFDLYARGQGKRLAGDKTPGYVRKLPILHRLWPSARFVHVIRDGRDVALSLFDWKAVRGGLLRLRRRGQVNPARSFPCWHEDRTSTAALFWEWNVRLGRAGGTDLGPALYHEVRYESLVADPAGECAAICAFLGVAYDEAMLNFHEGRERRRPFLSAKRAWKPVTGGLRDWRKGMSADEQRSFEAVAGGLLEELGYPRAHETSPVETPAQRRLRDSFNEEAARRGWDEWWARRPEPAPS
jgi:LPS sulfotransferase NodH